MVSRKIVVRNEAGLHVRPASVLAKAAESCSSKIEILFMHNIINAKSLLNIVSMAIAKGDEIELRCTGPSEEEDIEKITEVFMRLE